MNLLERLKEGVLVKLLLSAESSACLVESFVVIIHFLDASLIDFKPTSVDDDSHGAISLVFVGAVGSTYDGVLTVHNSLLVLAAFNSIVDEESQSSLTSCGGTVGDAFG